MTCSDDDNKPQRHSNSEYNIDTPHPRLSPSSNDENSQYLQDPNKTLLRKKYFFMYYRDRKRDNPDQFTDDNGDADSKVSRYKRKIGARRNRVLAVNDVLETTLSADVHVDGDSALNADVHVGRDSAHNADVHVDGDLVVDVTHIERTAGTTDCVIVPICDDDICDMVSFVERLRPEVGITD